MYDDVGRKTQQIDLEGHTTYFYYDEMNRLTKTYYPDNPPDDEEEPGNVPSVEEVYDKNGNRVEKKTKKDGLQEQDTTTYTYDERNRVETISYPGSEAGVTYDYDYAGNRLSMVDGHGTTSYEYDARNRLTKETKAQGWVLEYDYDLAGNKVEFKLTVNSSVNSTTYTYDEANRLKTVTDPEEGTSSYTYDKVGNRKTLSYPNGVVAEYTYNARNWLTDLHNHKGEATISRHTYTHYKDGNRETLTDDDGKVTTYWYDEASRLTQEKQVTGSQEVVYWHGFQYDDVGNMLKKLDLNESPPAVLAEYTYNAADQITNTGFDYDDRGNVLEESRPESEEEWDYTYDSQNRLLTATDGTHNYAYEYDGDGNRVKQTVNSIVTEFVVDLNGGLSQVVADINSGGNIKVLYVRGDDLISQQQNENRGKPPISRQETTGFLSSTASALARHCGWRRRMGDCPRSVPPFCSVLFSRAYCWDWDTPTRERPSLYHCRLLGVAAIGPGPAMRQRPWIASVRRRSSR